MGMIWKEKGTKHEENAQKELQVNPRETMQENIRTESAKNAQEEPQTALTGTMQQIQRIKTFDKELVSADPDKEFAYKFLHIFMGIFGSFLMVFPAGPTADPDLKVVYVLAWMFLGMAVMYRMHPYILAVGMGRVSEILAYVPVDKKLLRRVRRGYLRRYLVKLGAACLIAQQLGALFDGAWSIWNLLYPLGVISSLYLVGSLSLGWIPSFGWK